MSRVNVSEATGRVLDWMVAKCEGRCTDQLSEPGKEFAWVGTYNREYFYCTSWKCGGPIIERERLSVIYDYKGRRWCAAFWHEHLNFFDQSLIHGPTPLIAAMRCYVASKLGDEVEIPRETSHG